MFRLVPLQCGRVRVRCTSVLLRLRVTRSWKGKEASHSSDTSNRSFSFTSLDHVLLFYISAHCYLPYSLLYFIQFCSVFSSDDGEYIDGDEAVTYEGEEGGKDDDEDDDEEIEGEGEEEKKERKRSKSEKTERRRRRDKDNGRFKPKEFSAADLDSGEKISIKMVINMITFSLSTFPLNMIVFSSFSFNLFNVFDIIYYFSLAVLSYSHHLFSTSLPLLYISTSHYRFLCTRLCVFLLMSCLVLFCLLLIV